MLKWTNPPQCLGMPADNIHNLLSQHVSLDLGVPKNQSNAFDELLVHAFVFHVFP